MTTIFSIGNIAIAAACAAAIGLASGFKDSGASNLTAYQTKVAEFDAIQSPFQVQTVTLGDNIGTAIVSNNGYLIEVAFDYETVDDSNGVLGHSDVTIDITSLQINSVTNTATRQQYSDWTMREDHQQMIAQIRSYVDQNRLAEVSA